MRLKVCGVLLKEDANRTEMRFLGMEIDLNALIGENTVYYCREPVILLKKDNVSHDNNNRSNADI